MGKTPGQGDPVPGSVPGWVQHRVDASWSHLAPVGSAHSLRAFWAPSWKPALSGSLPDGGCASIPLQPL